MSDSLRLVTGAFPRFGPNKLREISRLVYEITRREGCAGEDVIASLSTTKPDFSTVKSLLECRRFPDAYARAGKLQEVYPEVDLDPAAVVDLAGGSDFYPEEIYIAPQVWDSLPAERVRKLFQRAVFIQAADEIPCFGQSFTAREYNRRRQKLYLVSERFDFFKRCPCSPGVVGCGYHNVNLGFGCSFDCSYCFLQSYANSPGIILPTNLDDFLGRLLSYCRRGMRIGSGETTDSLVFDHITGFSGQIVDFLRDKKDIVFEFKTKSDRIEGLLETQGARNVVVGWSLNPQPVIDREEHLTADLNRRIRAASVCAAHGYGIAMHLDPVIVYQGWQRDYEDMISAWFQAVPPDVVRWISLGTLRMTLSQKKMIENRFPGNTILGAELLRGFDNKLRYHDEVRVEVYTRLLDILKAYVQVPGRVYLCMESAEICRKCGLDPAVKI